LIDFFSFDTLITPYIIGFVYIFGAVVLPFIVNYFFKKYKNKFAYIKYKVYFFILLITFEILWRIFCEFFIVYFKIFLSIQGFQ